MRVFETQIPGVGVRYAVRFDGGRQLTVLVRNDGGRDVYWRDSEDEDSERLFRVDDDDAFHLAGIFAGTYFDPVETDLDDVLEDARVRWVTVSDDSRVAGRTIGDVGVRSATGATVVAIERGGETVTTPDANTSLEGGDVLVVVGDETAHDALRRLVEGS